MGLDISYAKGVKIYLKTNVWETLNTQSKQHDVDAAKIEQALKDASDREKIEYRDKRMSGTKICWANRHQPAHSNSWYHPFSMVIIPSRKHSGVSPADLTNIFKKLR